MHNYNEDVVLMLKLKKGDISAFEQIIKKYERPVINTIYRFIGNRSRAEEIAQEVFIKVYNSAKRYRPKAKFSTWLYKIVTNLCLDKLRKKENFSEMSFDNVVDIGEKEMAKEIPDSTQVMQDVILEKKESDSLIKEALDSMPNRQRMAIILREYNGLSYKEISKLLCCSTKAVESLLYHAKQGLKEKLMPYFKKEEI